MRKLLALVLLFTGVSVPWVDPAASAQEAGPVYLWSVDAPPFGPNVSSASDGFQLSLFGAGPGVGDGDTTGGGIFQLLDVAGAPVAVGTWKAHGHAQVTERGLEFPPVEQLKSGVVRLSVTFDGMGAGSLQILCDAEPGHLEGVTVQIGGRNFDTIVVGSTTLVRVV